MTRWLRSRVNGVVFEWNPILAGNRNCEEITEEQAFPENFQPAKTKARTPKVDLGDTVVAEAPKGNPELNLEASRGLK